MPKMRWQCETDGCFNVKCRPKIEIFDDCFPGKIAFSDMDGIVEINGNFLILEWKRSGSEIPTGQRILFERMTAKGRKTTVVVVHGDAETMVVDKIQIFKLGAFSGCEQCTLDDLKARIKLWAEQARLQP